MVDVREQRLVAKHGVELDLDLQCQRLAERALPPGHHIELGPLDVELQVVDADALTAQRLVQCLRGDRPHLLDPEQPVRLRERPQEVLVGA